MLRRDTLCFGDSLLINGTYYHVENASGMEVYDANTSAECDTILEIEITFIGEEPQVLELSIPEGDTVFFNGKPYWMAGEFLIQMGLTSQGCDSMVMLRLLQDAPEFSLYIPNSFSPNGDGLNDEFGVYSEGQLEVLRVEIYNRWGAKLYWNEGVIVSPDRLWNGYAFGEQCNPGTFVYLIVASDGRTQKSFSGDLMLFH